MKHKQGDVVRIKSGNDKTPIGEIPTMIMTYVGQEAVVEHVDPERKIYTIRILAPWIRGLIRFNVTERMIEPEINEAMITAGVRAADDLDDRASWDTRITMIYQAMRAARFEGAK